MPTGSNSYPGFAVSHDPLDKVVKNLHPACDRFYNSAELQNRNRRLKKIHDQGEILVQEDMHQS